MGVNYIISSHEPLWFVIGLVCGIVFMALVDFVIDRSNKRKNKDGKDI